MDNILKILMPDVKKEMWGKSFWECKIRKWFNPMRYIKGAVYFEQL